MNNNKISAMAALKATSPFIVVRSLVYLVTTAIMIVAALIGILLMATETTVGVWIGIFVFIGSVIFTKWVERYVLYLIKAGHVFALTQYIKTGQAPVTEKGYKSILAFGTEKVKDNFGATNVAFVADAMISRAVRQIVRFLNKVGDFLSFIPFAENIINVVSFILGIALNYVDEAVLSYIFMHDEEKNPWKKACDAIVYYGQSWKSMIKGAAKIAATILAARIIILLVSLFVGLGVGGSMGAIVGLIIGYIIMYALDKILFDPFATVVMIGDYYKAIEGQQLQTDLYAKFERASSKFKDLVGRSSNPVGDTSTMNNTSY